MNYSFPENFSLETKQILAKKFRKRIKLLFSDEISISYGKSILNLSSIDSLRMIFEQSTESQSETLFKNFLIKNFSDSERICPGSGFIATLAILESLSGNFDCENSLKELKKMSLKSHRGDLEDLQNFLDKINKTSYLSKVYNDILYNGGFSASCSIESTYDLEDSFLLDKATHFKVRLDPNFSSAVKKDIFKNSNAHIIVADGIIENISELHHVLEHYHNNGKWCFLICRGYGNDVISTLATNFLRGSLKIIPGVLITDIESINSLKDICIATGADLVSNLKGDSLSNINIESCPKVNTVLLDKQSLQINNPEKLPQIIVHVQHLRKTMALEQVQDKVDLLEKRIAALMPRKLKIYFSNHDKDSVGLKKDQAKILISLINSYCKAGKISLKEDVQNKLLVNIINEIKKLGVDEFPAMTFFEGIKAGVLNAEILKNSSKMILLNSDF